MLIKFIRTWIISLSIVHSLSAELSEINPEQSDRQLDIIVFKNHSSNHIQPKQQDLHKLLIQKIRHQQVQTKDINTIETEEITKISAKHDVASIEDTPEDTSINAMIQTLKDTYRTVATYTIDLPTSYSESLAVSEFKHRQGNSTQPQQQNLQLQPKLTLRINKKDCHIKGELIFQTHPVSQLKTINEVVKINQWYYIDHPEFGILTRYHTKTQAP